MKKKVWFLWFNRFSESIGCKTRAAAVLRKPGSSITMKEKIS